MITKCSQDDIAVLETLSNPIKFSEIMFDNQASLSEFTETKYSKIRAYQYPFFGFSSTLYRPENMTDEEYFKMKKGADDSLNFGGRLTGKTHIAIVLDVLIKFFHKLFTTGIVSSCDATKVRGVMQKIINPLENHPVLKFLGVRAISHPAYQVETQNGCKLESVNQNVSGKEPGKNYYQKHADIEWCEESSFLTEEVASKRLMSQAEIGIIERLCGMTDFSKTSPIGKRFDELKNTSIKINVPSYVNPTWTKEKDEDAIREFGGKNSPGYLTQILGKIVEDSHSVYEMERMRETYDEKRTIKNFELDKDNYFRYKEILIVEKPIQSEKIVIAQDIGEGNAPTEIIILSYYNGKWHYLYNITIFKLFADELYDINKYLMEKLGATIDAIDTTSGVGKDLAMKLSKDYPENVLWVNFNSNIKIGFATDEKGEIVYENGQPKYKEENVVDWSIQNLKNIFYNHEIYCPLDCKLDQQFGSIVAMRSGMKTLYRGKSADHLHQAFQVFSIAEWNIEFKNIEPVKGKKLSFGVA